MKITGLEAYLIPSALSDDDWCRGKDFVLVKLETDTGIVGWGEAYSGLHDCAPDLLPLIHRVGGHAEGLEPFAVKGFLAVARAEVAEVQQEAAFFAALSAVEIALWDIAGKALGTPVYRLLGGALRRRIPVYANCWSHEPRTPEALAAYAKAQVDKGYRAVKVYPFLYSEDLAEGAQRLTALREVLGPDIEILVDAWMSAEGRDISGIADILHRHGVRWFEDPIAPDDLESLAGIRQVAGLPIVSGENLCGKGAFHALLQAGAADILHPDTTLCGGILELREISVLAELYAARVALHNYNSMGVGLAASLQAAALVPGLVKLEHFPRFVAPSARFVRQSHGIGSDGCIGLSAAPGLGIEVDEAALAALAR